MDQAVSHKGMVYKRASLMAKNHAIKPIPIELVHPILSRWLPPTLFFFSICKQSILPTSIAYYG